MTDLWSSRRMQKVAFNRINSITAYRLKFFELEPALTRDRFINYWKDVIYSRSSRKKRKESVTRTFVSKSAPWGAWTNWIARILVWQSLVHKTLPPGLFVPRARINWSRAEAFYQNNPKSDPKFRCISFTIFCEYRRMPCISPFSSQLSKAPEGKL